VRIVTILNAAHKPNITSRYSQKEPKLARARQIPEWEEYDNEIAKFAQRLSREGRLQSDIAAADSNVLASAAAGTLETPPEEVEQKEVMGGERVRDEL